MSPSRLVHVCCVASFALVAIAACGGATVADSESGNGATTTTKGPLSSRSFDPRRYPTACATKNDCQLLPFIRNCTTCCGFSSVSGSQASVDLQSVENACQGHVIACPSVCPSAHSDCVNDQCVECSELPCGNGVTIAMRLDPGTEYLISATVDGQPTSCSLDKAGSTCTGGLQVLDGDVSDPSSSHIVVVALAAATAKSITLSVTRDGTVVGTKTFQPAYTLAPGPNGPQCDPKQCPIANESFP